MLTIILIVVAMLTLTAALLLILNQKKLISIKKNSLLGLLYFVLVIGIIYLLLALFGGTVWEKITAYRERVLSESEAECQREDAPYWCDL